MRVLNNSFNAQVLTFGLERDGHIAIAAVAPEPAVGAVEDGGEFALVAFDLLTLAVAVVVTLGAVVGLTVSVVVDRNIISCPLVTDCGFVEHFQLDFTGPARLQSDAYLIGL